MLFSSTQSSWLFKVPEAYLTHFSISRLISLLLMYLYGAGHNDLDEGNIHYKGHWKGRALKILAFLGPDKETGEAGFLYGSWT